MAYKKRVNTKAKAAEYTRFYGADVHNQPKIHIVKDLSRLGRDYVTVGQYTDIYFPDHNVRFIAINDLVDSDEGENEIAPFKNVMNEIYPRSASRAYSAADNSASFIVSNVAFSLRNVQELTLAYGLAQIIYYSFSCIVIAKTAR